MFPPPRRIASLASTLAAALLAAACSGTTGFGLGKPAQVADSEGNAVPYMDVAVGFPEFPKKENLVRYPTDWTTNQVYLDVSTMSFNNDIINYALLVRSESGANNYSFESLRCNGTRRVLAYGKNDNTWVAPRTSNWMAISDSRINRYYFEFWRDVFCKGDILFTKRDIVANLKRGGAIFDYASPGY